jgi:hypothetical protein
MNDPVNPSPNFEATLAAEPAAVSSQVVAPVAPETNSGFSLFSKKEIAAVICVAAVAWLYVQQYGHLIPSLGIASTNRIYVVDDAKLMQALLKDVLAHADASAPEKTEMAMKSRMLEIQNKIVEMEQGGIILLKKSSVMISGNKADITESFAKSLNLTLPTAEQNAAAQQKTEEMILRSMQTKPTASTGSPAAPGTGMDKGPGSVVD